MNKKMIIILSVLVLFLIIGGVSASETNTTDEKVSTSDTDDIISSTNEFNTTNELSISKNTLIKDEDVLNAKLNDDSDSNVLKINARDILQTGNEGTFKDLNALIRVSDRDSVVTLDKNYIYDSSIDSAYINTGLIISKSITIDGKGFTIDGKGLASIFTISENNVVLKNLKLTNTPTTQTPIIWNGDEGIVDNITFFDTGGKFIINWAGDLGKVINSKFLNCDGNGGAVGVYGKELYFKNCYFNKCRSTVGTRGSAISVEDNDVSYATAKIYYCNFTNCVAADLSFTATIEAATGGVTVDHCRFINNIGQTGGVSTPNVVGIITNCYFENCTSLRDNGDYSAGAVAVFGGGTVENCTFVNNKCNNLATGVVQAKEGSKLYNLTFINEYTTNNLIKLTGSGTTIEKLEVSQCNVENVIKLNNNANFIQVKDSNIYNNKINSIIVTGGSSCSIIFNNFYIFNNNLNNYYLLDLYTGNSLSYDGDFDWLNNNVVSGVDLKLYKSGITVNDLKLDNYLVANPSTFNDAVNKISYGGTIYLLDGEYTSEVTLTKAVKFIGCDKDNVILKSGNFRLNTIGCSFENLTFENARLTGNFAGRTIINNCLVKGFNQNNNIFGLNYAFESKYTNIDFINCNAYTYIHINRLAPNCLIENVTFTKCTRSADSRYYIADPVLAIISNITFSDMHDTKQYPYIYLTDRGGNIIHDIKIVNCENVFEVVYSKATSKIDYVDGFYINDSSIRIGIKDVGSVNNVKLNNVACISSDYGIIWYSKEFKNPLQWSNITYNTCQGGKYLICFNSNSQLLLDNLTITNCKDTAEGLKVVNGSILTKLNFKNVNFTDCISYLNDKVEIKNSEFNKIKGNLKIQGNNIKITNTKFINSAVSGNGGSIILESGDDLIIDKCTFVNNTAINGGAFYIKNVTNSVYILDSVFINNTASNLGGAVYIEPKIYYYISESTRETFNNTSCFNDLYDKDTKPLKEDVWVVLDVVEDEGTYYKPTGFLDALNKVSPFGTIHFRFDNEIYDFTNSPLEKTFVKFNVTFEGFNTTLKGINFIFSEYAVGVTVYNFIFENYSTNVIKWDGDDGKIINCTFRNNGGDDVSNGSYLNVIGNNLNIINSSFINNTAGLDESLGGAIYCEGSKLTIMNSNFIDNHVYDAGVHIYLSDTSKDLKIYNSLFSGGNSISNNGKGSAIYIMGSGYDISNSIFINNHGLYGGALYSNTGGTVNRSSFFNNSATNDGGALYLVKGSTNINSSNFTNNSAKNGGAIYTDSTLIINECNLTNNHVTHNGGAIYCNGARSELIGCTYINNTADSDGGGLYVLREKCIIKDSMFISNNASNGAAVRFYSNDASVVGAYYSEINNCTFKFNNAYWGTVHVGCENITVYNSSFIYNKATRGSAILFRAAAHNFIIDNINCINNAVTNEGGAIYSTSNNGVVRNSNFNGNNATLGGAIYWSGDGGSIVNSTFTGNKATLGGAIYWAGVEGSIVNSTFTGNKATNGSALYINPNADSGFELKNCKFENEISSSHGNVYASSSVSSLSLSKNNFTDCILSIFNYNNNYYLENNHVPVTSLIVYVTPDGTGSGLTEDDPTTIDKAWGIIENNGMIVFLNGEYEISKTISQNYTIVGRSGVTLKRSNDKYLFIPLSQFI